MGNPTRRRCCVRVLIARSQSAHGRIGAASANDPAVGKAAYEAALAKLPEAVRESQAAKRAEDERLAKLAAEVEATRMSGKLRRVMRPAVRLGRGAARPGSASVPTTCVARSDSTTTGRVASATTVFGWFCRAEHL